MSIEEEINGRFRKIPQGTYQFDLYCQIVGGHIHKSLKARGLAEQQYNVLRILRGFRTGTSFYWFYKTANA